MKKHITSFVALLSFVFVLSAVQTYAQAVESVRISIPFEFQVGKKLLPAGDYRISRNSSLLGYRHITMMELNGNGSVVLNGASVGNRDESLESGLVFYRYGSDYFLSEINYGAKKIKLAEPSSGDILTAQNRRMKPEIVTIVIVTD